LPSESGWFFGRYIGTVRRTGLTWVVPFSSRRRVSVRVNNVDTKCGDQRATPVLNTGSLYT
jgi:hypothetical protein